MSGRYWVALKLGSYQTKESSLKDGDYNLIYCVPVEERHVKSDIAREAFSLGESVLCVPGKSFADSSTDEALNYLHPLQPFHICDKTSGYVLEF